jgi:ribosomal protein L7Ae-like RNA K-turn-binding protein
VANDDIVEVITVQSRRELGHVAGLFVVKVGDFVIRTAELGHILVADKRPELLRADVVIMFSDTMTLAIHSGNDKSHLKTGLQEGQSPISSTSISSLLH